MARYEARHRPLAAPAPLAARTDQRRPTPRRRAARPVVAAGLALGLGLGAVGYAAATGSGTGEPAPAGETVAAQELALTSAVDTSYRAATVSRSESRTAVSAADLAAAKKANAQAKAKAEKKAKAAAEQKRRKAAEAARAKTIAKAKDNPRAAARALMAEHGWTSQAQYSCLVTLWNGESDWRWTASNPSSGAYGIPQSLPGSKMAKFGNDWRTNPVTQMKWGLWYIEQSYGSPCDALSFWQSNSPHWY
ncbi:MAG: lytic transglycosylase domain-containing protein [Intrasporangium sp.]|uniref:aggregation-promoting factor C-terminal-like domain-containing protein n=1 Tax=Intrasporangium sp. TaxID=1925024 RepID=UPI002648BAB9|nr:lytic transglycosylase domain-containing protein [Intrasporangium sp.]MDN5796960.1 lytic transglycosylase domain-containing protein [Intrasporangium sp.]